MSSIKFEVEDKVSEYLDRLQEGLLDEMEHMLREISYEATGRPETESAPIPKLIGRYNPWLFISGQTNSARDYEISPEQSIININYSGMRYEEWYSEEEFTPWWQFAVDFDSNPRTAVLDRDYAFYQETGVDEVASPVHAKHQHAIEWGLLYAAGSIRKETARQLRLAFGRI